MTLRLFALVALILLVSPLAFAKNTIPQDAVSLRAFQLQPARYENETLIFHMVRLEGLMNIDDSLHLAVRDGQSPQHTYQPTGWRYTSEPFILPLAIIDDLLPYVENLRYASLTGTVLKRCVSFAPWCFVIDTIRILDEQGREYDLILVPNQALKESIAQRQ